MANLENKSTELDPRTKAFLKEEDFSVLFPDQNEQDMASIIEVIDVLHKTSNFAQLRKESAVEILELVDRQWKLQETRAHEKSFSKIADLIGHLNTDFRIENLKLAGIALSITLAAFVLLSKFIPTMNISVSELSGNTASNLSDAVTSNLSISAGVLVAIFIVAVAIIFIIFRRD